MIGNDIKSEGEVVLIHFQSNNFFTRVSCHRKNLTLGKEVCNDILLPRDILEDAVIFLENESTTSDVFIGKVINGKVFVVTEDV